MTLEELLDNITKDTKLDQEFKDKLKEEVSKNITIVNGVLVANETTQNIVKNALRSFYNSNAYRKSIAKLLYDITEVTKGSKDYAQRLGINTKPLNETLKLAIDEQMANYNELGLNSRYNQPLRKMIYDSIRLGYTQRELYKNIDKYVDEKGITALNKNTALMAVDTYDSIINQTIVDKNKDNIDYFLVTNTLIETSSPQCRLTIEKYKRKLTKEEWDNQVKTIAKENGYTGSGDFYALPSDKLHYGCRHSFTPVLKKIK